MSSVRLIVTLAKELRELENTRRFWMSEIGSAPIRLPDNRRMRLVEHIESEHIESEQIVLLDKMLQKMDK